jgi:hypothetical protein
VREIKGEYGAIAGEWIDMPDDARTAAVGDQTNAGPAAEVEKAPNVVVGSRVGDAIRERADLPGAQGHPVWKTLAAGMEETVLRIAGDQRMRRKARGRDRRQGLLEAHVRAGDTLPDQAGQIAGGRLWKRI